MVSGTYLYTELAKADLKDQNGELQFNVPGTFWRIA